MKKKACKRHQNFSRDEKEKKSWLSIEKNTIEQEKTLYYNYKKAF